MHKRQFIITFKTGIKSIQWGFTYNEAEILAQAEQINLGNDFVIINTEQV